MITNYLLIEVEERARTPFNEDVVELEEVDDDLTSILVRLIERYNYQKTGDL